MAGQGQWQRSRAAGEWVGAHDVKEHSTLMTKNTITHSHVC